MNLCKITPKYLLWPRFEYLHFRQIWDNFTDFRILFFLFFSCRCIMVEGGIIGPNAIWYSLRGRILWPRIISYLLRLRYQSFGIRLEYKSRIGPRFVKICIQLVLLLPFSKTDGQTSFGTSLNLQWRPSTKESRRLQKLTMLNFANFGKNHTREASFLFIFYFLCRWHHVAFFIYLKYTFRLMPAWSVDNLECSTTTSKDNYFENRKMVTS